MIHKRGSSIKFLLLLYRIVRKLIPGPHPFVRGGGYNEKEREDCSFVFHLNVILRKFDLTTTASHFSGNEMGLGYTFWYGLRAKRGTMINLIR